MLEQVYPWNDELKNLYKNFISIVNYNFLSPFSKEDKRNYNYYVIELSSTDNIYEICKYIYNKEYILPGKILVNGNVFLDLDFDERQNDIFYIKYILDDIKINGKRTKVFNNDICCHDTTILKSKYDNINYISDSKYMIPYWDKNEKGEKRLIIDVSEKKNIIDICELFYLRHNCLPYKITVNGEQYIDIDDIYKPIEYINEVLKQDK